MKRSNPLFVLAPMALALAAGCSSLLAPRADPSKFFVLSPVASDDAPPPVAPGHHELAIGLGPVTLPDYLTHLEVVTRVAPNQIELSPTDRWAEPLDESFRAVLARDLTTMLGNAEVVPYPWYASAKLNYRVEVTVERFERDNSGGTQLVADWTIRGAHGDRPLVTRRSNFSETAAAAPGSAGTASAGAGDTPTDSATAALSADLGDLGKDIAGAVTALNSTHRQN